MGFLSDLFEILFNSKPSAAQPPETAVCYKLHFGRKECELTFKYEKLYREAGDMRGYKYILNRREYTDIESFCGRDIEKITEDVSIMEDAYKNKVLNCYQSIPTFDSEDREWDSALDEFLMFDGKDINLVVCRHGYKIPSFKVYGGLTSAPDILKPYFKKMDFPINGIKWLNVNVEDSKLRVYSNV